MSPVSLPRAAIAPLSPGVSFEVSRSHTSPHYHQLSLADAQGCLAHWIIPLSLKHLLKQPALLWQLPATSVGGPLTRLDTGALQLAPAHPGLQPSLPADLVEGVLRLCFEGHLLRGYFRLQCLPQGGGQLWQPIPIGSI
ncbi:hypothetical protein [Hymenobacter bucti]|uniref:Uncharacterized protein n=1 Tax=Hymenobacter bucti TaxID=1844114 RepID=A0ABW4QUG8_9BACT